LAQIYLFDCQFQHPPYRGHQLFLYLIYSSEAARLRIVRCVAGIIKKRQLLVSRFCHYYLLLHMVIADINI
jgi:hypothetical protein